MRVFTDIKKCFNWADDVVQKTVKEAIPEIARQEYQDSKKYTYIDTGEMYGSGQQSDFNKGYVVIKAPQVRWLYYIPANAGPGNRNAVPQWHEATKRENMNKYKNIYINNFKKNKKG